MTEGVKGYRLSPPQQRLWWLQGETANGSRGRTPFWSQAVLRLSGAPERSRLEEASRLLVRRHELLRTRFAALPGMGLPLQVIDEEGIAPVVSWHELEGRSLGSARAVLEQVLAEAREQEVEWERGVGLQVAVLGPVGREREWWVTLSLPALYGDGRGVSNVGRELASCYAALGEEGSAGAEVVQYADLSEWQNELMEAEETQAGKAYWAGQDGGGETVAQWERWTRQYGKSGASEEGKAEWRPARVRVRLSGVERQRLAAAAREVGVGVREWILGCWALLWSRLSSQAHLVIATHFDGRNYEELKDALGLFERYLPIRLHLHGGMSIKELLKQITELTNDAYQWQECFTWEQPAPSIQDVTDVPFWPIGFEFREPSEQLRVADLTLTVEDQYSCTERFHLKLVCEGDGGGGVRQLWVEYDRTRFATAVVKELAEHLRSLLAAAGRAPERAVSRLALLSERQRQRVIEISRGPRVEVGQSVSESVGVHELFAQQVAQRPDRLAVVCGSEAVSYGELNRRAEWLAERLRQEGVGAESRVGLLLERTVATVVGILGVLKAGGAYVPLEVGYPDERLRYVVEDAGLAIVVSEESEAERVRRLGAKPVLCGEGVETNKEENVGGAVKSIAVSGTGSSAVSGVSGENLCYVIYTSGSTGRPKGVMVTHGQLRHYVSVARRRLGLREGMRYGLLTTFAADLGHTVTFPALCTGGCLHVVPTEVGLEARRLSRYLREQEIECVKMVPSQLAALVRSGERVLPQSHLVLGGEALTEGLVEQVREQAAGTELVLFNHYGPTETTVGAVAGRVWPAGERRDEASAGKVAVGLGRALGNTSVYVVDKSGEVVPQGVAGEVYIGGAGVARGYLERPELTAERFIPDAFSSEAGARLYRTGDQARYRADGELEFLGRIDNQVKIRGYRIELGEIEAALCGVAGVREAVVLARLDAQEEQRLVAYVVMAAAEQAGVDQGARLRRELATRLPDYMVPAVIVELAQLPLTVNGKVDRRALPEPARSSRKGSEQAGARTPVEELLCGIWAEVLGVEGVGVEDNFFELGGHSLLATQVVSRVRETCGVELALRELFEAPSVRLLAAVVEEARRAGEGVAAPPIVAVRRDRELPLSFAQQRLWFLDQLEPHNPFYNIPAVVHLQGTLDQQALAAAFTALMRRHESLRTSFAAPEGRPQQVIGAPEDFALEVEDLSEVNEEERLERATELAAAEAQRPFALESGGLLRVKLLRLSAEEHVLALVMHHIVSDGWSMGVLVRELVELYGASRTGREAGLDRLTVQYADFAVWQRGWLSGVVLERQLGYWRQQLAGAPALLELPTDYPRPAVQSHRGATVAFAVPGELTAELKELSRRSGVTLFMTLLAAFDVLLLHYTGQSDIVVGTNIANRNRAETENLIGFFINQLVLRVNQSGNPTFVELLERVREVTLEAYAHQDLPFERLVEELQPERDRSRALLYQAKLEIQNVAASSVGDVSGLKVKFINIPNKVARYDLYLSLADSAQGLQGTMLYNADLFKPDTITRMIENLKTLLSAVIERPDAHLDELTQLLAAQDRQHQELIEKEIENAGLQMLRNIQRRAISQVDV